MKKLAVLFSVACLALVFLSGCETIPDDQAPSLRLRISVPDRPPASAALGPAAADLTPAASDVMPPPPFDVYHLRVSLTNPDEVFYVYFYEPGTSISLMVTPGQARTIDVEAWMVPGDSVVPTAFNNRNLITVTPVAERTVDLIAEPVTVNLLLDYNPNVGEVYADPPYTVLIDGYSLYLPISPTCPSPSFVYVTVTDKKWGIPFPSVIAPLFSGQNPARLSVSGLPLGRDYAISLHHDSGGYLGTTTVSLNSSPLGTELVLTEYTRSFITGTPEKPLVNLIPDDLVDVGLTVEAGLGSFGPFTVAGSSLGGYDTCGGVISGSTYTFIVPDFMASCTIHVAVTDCAGLITEYLQEVSIVPNPPPDCMDGVDNDLDGFIDYPNDPGCSSAADTAETDAARVCDDGLNNDTDGLIDAFDPGCSGPTDPEETDAALPCDDGTDNDGWSDIDMLDPGCSDPMDAAETDPAVACDDGMDNDGWTDIDAADPGCASAVDTSEFDPLAACDDGVDNDGWTDVDVSDLGCTGPADTSEYSPSWACDDGLDNDGWGDIDVADPGCNSPTDVAETSPSACDDGIDNPDDTDTLADSNDPGCTGPTDMSELGATACDNGLDDDNWGDVDTLDPGCAGPADTDEFDAAVACDDGVDSDGWGAPDWMDAGCTGPTDASEYGPDVCDDGADNDGWGDIDVADPGCAGPTDASELDPAAACDDGADNDGWGDADAADPGCASAVDTAETDPAAACDDGADNDGWGDADVADIGCADAADASEYGVTICDDGVDNDGDGLEDRFDGGCADPLGTREWRIWFVDLFAAGLQDGQAWPDAFLDIQSAVNAAGIGDQIWVAEGTYTGPGGDTLVTMKSNIIIFGGFVAGDTTLADRGNPFSTPTIINGGYIYSHVVRAASNSTLDGVAVTGGLCSGCRGAGIIAENVSNFTVSQCDIYSNTTGGGFAAVGMYLRDSTNSLVIDTRFHNNGSGGGDSGGGALQWGGIATFRNCLFYVNSAGNYLGGGLGAVFTYAPNTTVQNCTFYGNIASLGGNAIDAQYSTVNVINSIIWDGAAPFNEYGGGVVNASYSDVSTNWAGTGNIQVLPGFTTGPQGYYYLLPGSACVNSGSIDAVSAGMSLFTTDPAGLLDSGTVDMGFHYQP